MKIKARIIEKDSLEQMYNIRYDFHAGSRAGKMNWEDIEVETVLESLANDGVMTFTKKFGEVDMSDIDKIKALLK
jgi:hypothetical protein